MRSRQIYGPIGARYNDQDKMWRWPNGARLRFAYLEFKRSGGLGHIVTPADRLARIAHDPQRVCQRQLAGCGCFLPHLLVCTAGRSLGPASARPFSTVSVHRAIARLIENRGPCVSASGSLVLQYGTDATSAARCGPSALVGQNELIA